MRILTVVLIVIASAANAQPSLPAAASGCGQSQTSGAYISCALWIDQGVLKRGASGHEIGHLGLFSPLPLAEAVTGDSAMHYALRYERNTRRGMRLGVVGTTFILSGALYARSKGCHDITCSERGNVYGPLALGIVGGAFLLASVPFTLAGQRACARAIWWSNASLGR